MVLSDPRNPEQSREIPQHSASVWFPRKAHHQAPQRIDDVDISRREGKRVDEAAGGARDRESLVLAQQGGVGIRSIVNHPYALHPVGVPAEREPRLAHVHELPAAALAARAGVDLQQHPLAPQLGETEGRAVQPTKLRVGQGAGLDQLPVVGTRLGLSYEIGEPCRDGGRGAERQDHQRDSPAAPALLIALRGDRFV